MLRRGGGPPAAKEFPLFHGTGVLPGVDLQDSAALLDLMDKGI